MQKITPFLWFDTQAEEAMQFYTASFKNSRIISIQRYPEGPLEAPMKGMEGKVIHGVFELNGQQFMALDGGPAFKFTRAITFSLNCETEAESDRLWERLSDGGRVLIAFEEHLPSKKIGWTIDKYGLSWQINFNARPQEIRPMLIFGEKQPGKAEEATKLYTSLFENSHIEKIERNGEGGDAAAVFRLSGQKFMATDSIVEHSFTEAISFYVACNSQEEVDHFWNKLSADPQAERCGWLKDKFGLSWQIIPTALPELLNDPDPEKSKRVMDAMLQMKKIDISGLKRAYAG